MCGIAGGVAHDVDSGLPGAVAGLTEQLRHRGPDGCGYWTRERGLVRAAELLPSAASVVLGHRRLSIVDLAGGAQPLCNEDESVWVSYNGEVFNAPQLRRELIDAGHRFQTTSDTEVIVHGWEEWGVSLFGRLNGMFAFALHDAKDGTTRLVRDPIGIKPLYVGASPRLTWWASELRGAITAGLLRGSWSADALKLYLMFRFVPSPFTLYEGVWKLPPSHYVELDNASAGAEPEFIRYATTVKSTRDPQSERDWERAIIEELDDAVNRQLMADVPVASLLSGGIDSSLVTSLMARRDTGTASFAVGFASHGEANETSAARFAADQLGVPLDTRLIRDEEYIAEWPGALRAMSEPIGNASSLLLGHACRLAASTHKVVLTGQGADEPLGGYPRHVAERLYQLGKRAPRASSLIAQRLLGSDAGPRLRRALGEPDLSRRFTAILGVVPPEQADRVVRGGAPAAELARRAIARWLPANASEDPLNALLEVDVRMSLADDLLIVADHFSMAESVELRVPFLDLELFELMSRMPSSYKVSAIGRRKWLYRRAALRELPRPLARELASPRHSLGKKVGFRTPVDRWFASSSTALSQTRWSSELFELPAIDPSGAKELLAGNNGDGTRLRNVLFTLTQWAARD